MWVFTMTAQEQLILDIVAKISTGKMGRKEGQRILNVSERTLRRYLAEYQKRGVLFVQHKNSKNIPANKSSDELKKRVLKLVREKYFDFNLTHCLEKLKSDEKIEINRETFRQWCHEIHMVKRAKRREPKIRRRRDRMEQTGVMLQMDGSPHAWFGGKPSCLIAAIDDADSDVPFGEFFASEDTISCMRVLQKIVEKKGLFQILYVDRAGIFGGPKRANFSQVKRALEELGIHILFANSAEAKGRIERLWDTLQDRLIPEMRLRQIRSFENANTFLQEQFLPGEYAEKFKVVPANLESAYKPLPHSIDLKEVFCLKEHRGVKRDHTFSWNNQIYRIDSPLKHSIYKQKLEIRTYQDLSWRVFFAGQPIAVSEARAAVKATALPNQPCVAAEISSEKVRLDGHIRYLGRYYSVDEKYAGQKVSVTEKDGQVLIYLKGQLIETHPKLIGAHSLCSTKTEHLSPWKRAMEAHSSYRRAAQRLGPAVDQLVLNILQRGNGFIDNSTIWGIINMDESYTPAAINEVCACALELETWTYRAVKGMLKLKGTRYQNRLASGPKGPRRPIV
jgi:transposase